MVDQDRSMLNLASSSIEKQWRISGLDKDFQNLPVGSLCGIIDDVRLSSFKALDVAPSLCLQLHMDKNWQRPFTEAFRDTKAQCSYLQSHFSTSDHTEGTVYLMRVHFSMVHVYEHVLYKLIPLQPISQNRVKLADSL